MKRTLGVIPARMASSRFPGKPLEKILDIPMLAHCYERALISSACDNLVIATPDQEIIAWANLNDIPSVLTSHSHQRATDRAKETLDILSREGDYFDFILLLQGDEPQILPEDIANLKNAFTGKEYEAVNLVFPISKKDLEDPNVVKAIINQDFDIKFFSRTHVPHNCLSGFRQLGMIGFTNRALLHYADLSPTPLEEVESIDMMRFLENDFSIQGVLSSSPIFGVDNPEDIIKVENMMRNDHFVRLYKNKYI
jgi:3-deoxy-manno-octulosonate cytidylyltransferase (CMP-KDO synthetase)